MNKKLSNQLTPVFVLDVNPTGYSIMRSLYKYKIPLYGFTFDTTHWGYRSSYAKNVILYKNTDEDLLDKLLQLRAEMPVKPVLFLSNDEKVQFAIDNWDVLQENFLMRLSDKDLTQKLIDKTKLPALIDGKALKLPKNIDIESIDDLPKIKELQFPIILKPFLKSDKWLKSFPSKAYIFDTFEELAPQFEAFYQCENKLIVQEFIPGKDDDVHYCLVYSDKNGKVHTSFTGQKIRQYDALTGTTTSTRQIENKTVESLTIDFFNQINFKGMGSLEFKQHAVTKDYYLIEPTAGRPDGQEFVANAAGVNIPLIAYNEITEHNLTPKEKKRNNAVFMDEVGEVIGVKLLVKNGELSFWQWIKSLKGHIAFRYISFSDWRVSMFMGYITMRRTLGILLASIRR
ncbi:hypothetical protein [Carboxylicivirga sp. M1479]|uniref:carboxylate--amine ligase n=1 Tax=Carboxylicivirga sp. M1479 TaxID=2594476 RepID=UPI0011781225|nr:hypothetical protein [Carboxylicivirga sp. M1479]TRX66351.1 hypothetical protein FNN09_14185 [Carboxylicivirga sp. M1479]